VDTPVRMDGDEFCILLPHQTASRASALAERLVDSVERVESPGGRPLSVAIGVVSCPQHATEADSLLELADSTMYRAKAAGEHVAVGPEAAATTNGNKQR
jgi:diguanylate cyclase (GGDEF)-like protein